MSKVKGSTDPAKAIASVSYEDLYRRWEESNWSATAIDFSRDREGWRELSEIQRRSVAHALKMLRSLL